MGIFSKLFGRKKKDTKKVSNEPQREEQKTESADEVTLQEVNESLDEVNTISKDEPAKQSVTPSPEKDEAVKAEPSEPPKPEPKETDESPVYHIKKHPDGWQVIKENADKAYRVFDYQKEAIDFAKNENLEYQVYKADGTLRK